ncbi:PadR family transcriptional regulator [Dokdonella ginsengisoli]|uniref:PadR family transcriptional regulator n=1 Tax=Dokdonella ginsengisoli TaxID=363846 RepID=A0ABV9QXF3_9GAMM
MRHPFFHRARECADHFEQAFWFGRHPRERGFGPFSAGFMGGGLGGHGFRSGRKLGSSELQLVLLALLAAQPSHGYELIKALEERSGGFYSPSPGMVYPALTYLDEVGYAEVEVEGAKKRYSISAAGREYLRKHQQAADAILSQLERIGAKMGRVRDIFSGEAEDGGDEADERGGGPAEVWFALRELRHALRGKRHAGAREARRIAEILQRAVAEITGREK